MDINKSDFKIIYNITKNFKSSNNFDQLINNVNNNKVEDNNFRNVINNNNINNVIKVINKLNKFSFPNNNDSDATSLYVPDTISDIDSETSIDDVTSTFIPAIENGNNQVDSETSYNIDYNYNFNTEELNNYNSETSENRDIVKYENMDDIINKLLDTDTLTPKRIREKYNSNNDIRDLLNMI